MVWETISWSQKHVHYHVAYIAELFYNAFNFSLAYFLCLKCCSIIVISNWSLKTSPLKNQCIITFFQKQPFFFLRLWIWKKVIDFTELLYQTDIPKSPCQFFIRKALKSGKGGTSCTSTCSKRNKKSCWLNCFPIRKLYIKIFITYTRYYYKEFLSTRIYSISDYQGQVSCLKKYCTSTLILHFIRNCFLEPIGVKFPISAFLLIL